VRTAIVIAPFALLATSCGGKNTTSLGKAVERTEAKAGYHVVMSSRFDRSPVVHTVGDYAGQRGSFEVRYDLGKPVVLSEIVDGTTLYLHSDSPSFFKDLHLPRGKHWISIDLNLATPLFGQTAIRRGSTPLGAARILSTSKSMKLERDAGTGGASHYSGSIPSPRARQGKVQAQPMLVDVWVGKDGYVRQVRAVSIFKPKGFTAPLKTTTVSVLSRLGEDVRIQLPPVDDTVDRTAEYAKALS
jgi:hypothetical protein